MTLGARNGVTAAKEMLSRFFGLPRMVHGRSLGSLGVTLLQNTTSAIFAASEQKAIGRLVVIKAINSY